MRALFVCTGNICRSPFAERFTQHWAQVNGAVDLSASSAGTRAVVGGAMEPHAARMLTQFGGTAAGFAGQQLTARHVNAAQIVLTMTQSHRDYVLKLAPAAMLRTFTLTEAARICEKTQILAVRDIATARTRVPSAIDAPDIEDPYRKPYEVFDRVCRQIAAELDIVLGALRATL